MNGNPLFPQANDPPAGNSYLLHHEEKRVVPGRDGQAQGANEALSLIRQKIDRLYSEEPDAGQEEREAEAVRPRSRHQQFMYELSNSGKSLSEIQAEWHNYYVNLPNEEKFQVWQEFYESNNAARQAPAQPATMVAPPSRDTASKHLTEAKQPASIKPSPMVIPPSTPEPETLKKYLAPANLRETIRDKVTGGGRLTARHHLQSLAFGFAVGLVTLVVFLFGFFNEVIIAPFIQPGRAEGATPIIIDPATAVASANPEIIIPKINLDIPVDFSQTSTDETTIENALESGIVHYPSTGKPGQDGNAAFFGHSSNNIFNPGKYKFAFVLLHELVPGDTFYITNNGKTYIYRVFSKQIVEPTDVSVLGNVPGHSATATLITCDPPGTSLHRLVVVGDQISPDPSSNAAASAPAATTTAAMQQLPGNGPTLLSRIWNAIF